MLKFIYERSKCVTVYSGIDLKKFDNIAPDKKFLVEEFDLDPGKVIIGIVGAIDAAKDHFTYVDAIARIVNGGHPVQGLIIGDGPLASVLKDYVQKKLPGENIRFAGHRKDVGRLLISLDIFLITSKEEGLGTSILDAFLARVPVVATDAGGIPEIVKHEQTGLLAPVQDSKKLSDNIIRLLTNNALRQMMIDRAYEFVREFSREETSSKTFKIYQEVLGK
jgi:Glycosyltransferase